ncbi:MAG: hypothetical protein ABSD98_00970 [Candidatus Korobacteraceae bacterium]|jgi:hypothetical protein
MKAKSIATFVAAIAVLLLGMTMTALAADQINLGDGLTNAHFNGNATAVVTYLIPSTNLTGGYYYMANGSASGTGHLQSSGTYQIYSASSGPFYITYQSNGTFKVTQSATIYFNYSAQQGNLTGQLSLSTITPTSNQLIYTVTGTLTSPGGSYARYFPDGGNVTISMEVTFPLTTLTTVTGFAAAEFQTGTVVPANHCGNYTHNHWQQNQNQWQHGQGLWIGCNWYSDNQVENLLQTSEWNDASMYLAHRLIGALLNIANGSKQDPVQSFIDDANLLLGNAQLPQQINPNSAVGQQMLGDAYVLDNYNNNNITTAASH